MRKIGVLTYHRSINYGAVWQGISLVEALKKYTSYDVELVDFVYKTVKKRDGIFKTANPISIFIRYKRHKVFSTFLKNQYLNSPMVSDSYQDFIKMINQSGYDAIVVGSDEVWKVNSSRPLKSVYWLNHIKGIKKFSFAASSNNTMESLITEEIKDYIKDSLDDFDYVSVRDMMTKNMLSSYISEDKIHLNYDPGFLLDLNNYSEQKFIEKQKIRIQNMNKKNKKVLGIMVRDLNTQKIIYRNLHEEFFIVSIIGNSKWSDLNYDYLTPTEWLNTFNLFNRFVTDFFHGAIFSMKNKIPYICIDTREQYKNKMSKIEYMMTDIGIQKYYFCKYKHGFNWDYIFDVIESLNTNYPQVKINNFIDETYIQFESYINEIKQIIESESD